MNANSAEKIYPLLGDLSEVPSDYIREVAQTKRLIERWVMDPAFRDALEADSVAAIGALGLDLTIEQVRPLIDVRQEAVSSGPGLDAEIAALPSATRRYAAFIGEKLAQRDRMREEGESADRRMAAWRSRQLNRCRSELGIARTSAIIQAPMAIELSKGCTVGCWFCGVSAPKFAHWWPYTEENGELWRGVLSTLRATLGDCVRHGFLYWATDPLDNPDYERFLADFHAVTGRCPQTTTAIAQKDVERTRRLLDLFGSLGSDVDRFSIIALNSLYRIHEALSPEEMLRIECVPQNKEAASVLRKSNAGRARKFSEKRKGELVTETESSTIACVSGFLLNMVDRSIQLVTPCDSSERWPLGYWVIDKATFDSAEELRDVVEGMIAGHMRPVLRLQDEVRLRRDLTIRVDRGDLVIGSKGPDIVFHGQSRADNLAALLTEGTSTVEDIAVRRERSDAVPLAETLSVLDHMFAEGLLDEEPPAPAPAKVALGMPEFVGPGAR